MSISPNAVELPTICLNMIVRNESKIMPRLLASVKGYIDSYCICDTGSTDTTITVIEECMGGLPGMIFTEPFVNFAHNRTVAVRACYERMTPRPDFILLLDADMIFTPKMTPDEFREYLATAVADIFMVAQGTSIFYYNNVRIVRNSVAGLKYVGVTHEFFSGPSNFVTIDIPMTKLFITDVGDGGCKADKFERDIRLLKQGIIDEPDMAVRYTFYLANTYRELPGHIDDAIENYKKRVEMGGYYDERYMSCYELGHLYMRKGDKGNALHWFLHARQYNASRLEAAYEAFKLLVDGGMREEAYALYSVCRRVHKGHEGDMYLFKKADVYDFWFDYNFSLLHYYTANPDKIKLAQIYPRLLSNCPDGLRETVVKNLKFYCPRILRGGAALYADSGLDVIGSVREVYVPAVTWLGKYQASTPSVIVGDMGGILVRYVNYKIRPDGSYDCYEGNITTRNVWLSTVTPSFVPGKEVVSAMCREKYDDIYKGYEDMRLLRWGGNRVIFTANRPINVPGEYTVREIKIVVGEFDPRRGEIVSEYEAHWTGAKVIEKNWVMFAGGKSGRDVCLVYSWHPITILGTINGGNIGAEWHHIGGSTTPAFFKEMRGSTCGIDIGNEQRLFITHFVSSEDVRYYYHCFVILDAIKYSVVSYSAPFMFDGHLYKIEYCLGLDIESDGDTLHISFSQNDACGRHITASLAELRRCLAF